MECCDCYFICVPQNALIDNSGKHLGMIFYNIPSKWKGFCTCRHCPASPASLLFVNHLFIPARGGCWSAQLPTLVTQQVFECLAHARDSATIPGLCDLDLFTAYQHFSPLMHSGHSGAPHLGSSTHLLTPALCSLLEAQVKTLFLLEAFFHHLCVLPS